MTRAGVVTPEAAPCRDVALGPRRVLRISTLVEGRVIHLRVGEVTKWVGCRQPDLAVLGSLILRRRELPTVLRALATVAGRRRMDPH